MKAERTEGEGDLRDWTGERGFDAPERMWIDGDAELPPVHRIHRRAFEDGVEYVRADIYDEEIATREIFKAKITALEQERDGWKSSAIQLGQAAEEQSDELTRLREVIRWLVNLAHGMGKAGGPPEEGEWDAAWKNAADCLIGALTEGEKREWWEGGVPCPDCGKYLVTPKVPCKSCGALPRLTEGGER